MYGLLQAHDVEPRVALAPQLDPTLEPHGIDELLPARCGACVGGVAVGLHEVFQDGGALGYGTVGAQAFGLGLDEQHLLDAHQGDVAGVGRIVVDVLVGPEFHVQIGRLPTCPLGDVVLLSLVGNRPLPVDVGAGVLDVAELPVFLFLTGGFVLFGLLFGQGPPAFAHVGVGNPAV